MNAIAKLLTRLLVLGALVALVGCGDSGEESAAEGSSATSGEASTVSGDDEAAVQETVLGWMFEGGCERMTDKFLEDQTFINDPEEACSTFEAGFTAPAYSEDDVVISDVEVDGDEASLTVGDGSTDIESSYSLVNEDGVWKIDGADLL